MERDPLRLAWTTRPALHVLAALSSPWRACSSSSPSTSCGSSSTMWCSAHRRCRCSGWRSTFPLPRAAGPRPAPRLHPRAGGLPDRRSRVPPRPAARRRPSSSASPRRPPRGSAAPSWRGCAAPSSTACWRWRPAPATAPRRRWPSPATPSPGRATSSARRCWRPFRRGPRSPSPSSTCFPSTGASPRSPGPSFFLAAALSGRRLGGRLEAMRARRDEGLAVDQAFADLLRRVPALRAHGTAAFERQRISVGFAATTGPSRRSSGGSPPATASLPRPSPSSPSPCWGLPPGLPGAAALSPGEVAAAAVAALIAAVELRSFMQWQRLIEQVRPFLEETVRSLGALPTRERRERHVPFGELDPLVAAGVSAYDPAQRRPNRRHRRPAYRGPRTSPSSGTPKRAPAVRHARRRHLDVSTGRLTFGGVDLEAVDPAVRAQRIAFAAARRSSSPARFATISCTARRPDGGPATPASSQAAARPASTGWSTPAAWPAPSTRAGSRSSPPPSSRPAAPCSAALAARGHRRLRRSVQCRALQQPCDSSAATLPSASPIGDTFREERLAAHPFVRADPGGRGSRRSPPRSGWASTIATQHDRDLRRRPRRPRRCSSASRSSRRSDRPYFEDLVEPAAARNAAGVESGRDRERLDGTGPAVFRGPASPGTPGRGPPGAHPRGAGRISPGCCRRACEASIEFYHEERICTAASVLDNLLFGRIASEQAGAEAGGARGDPARAERAGPRCRSLAHRVRHVVDSRGG